jgi:hypothetical protein
VRRSRRACSAHANKMKSLPVLQNALVLAYPLPLKHLLKQ